jgi:hypothetical protein
MFSSGPELHPQLHGVLTLVATKDVGPAVVRVDVVLPVVADAHQALVAAAVTTPLARMIAETVTMIVGIAVTALAARKTGKLT